MPLLGIQTTDAEHLTGDRGGVVVARERLGIDPTTTDVQRAPRRRRDLPHQLRARVVADADHEVGGDDLLREVVAALVGELVPSVHGHAPRPRLVGRASAASAEGGREPREVARRAGEVRVDVMDAGTLAVVPEDQRFEEVERAPEHGPCVGTAAPHGIEERPDEGAGRATERLHHQPGERDRADGPDGGRLHAGLLVGGRQHLVVGRPLQRHREDLDAGVAHCGDLALDERVRHERIAVQHVADACTLQLGIARCGRHGLRIVPASTTVDFPLTTTQVRSPHRVEMHRES